MTSHRPLVVEDEQHYWRRRANRRIRKRRFTRNLTRWAIILSVNLLIATVLISALVGGLRSLAHSEEFSLDRIELAGHERASAQAIRSNLAGFLGHNLFDVDLLEVGETVQRNPWVLAASVKREVPDCLRVEIQERRPTALALIGDVVHLVDATGYVIGPCGPGTADDLPVLTGIESLEGDALIAALRRGVELIQQLGNRSADFAAGISELDLSQDDRVLIRTVSGGPLLLLDPQRIERNVQDYLSLSDEIERRSGPLDYVDLRWANRISVMPIFSDPGLSGPSGNR